MLAQGPTCALARVSYMTSTRPNAQVNHYPNGPILHRDMAPFYSAIDSDGRHRVFSRIKLGDKGILSKK